MSVAKYTPDGSAIVFVVQVDSNGNPTGGVSAISAKDWSMNKTALPVVGAATFGGATAMATWTLLGTIPAAARSYIRISATGGQRIAFIEDDGTALAGAIRVNASIDYVDGGNGTDTQGGETTLAGHIGRFEIYGPVGTEVYVREW